MEIFKKRNGNYKSVTDLKITDNAVKVTGESSEKEILRALSILAGSLKTASTAAQSLEYYISAKSRPKVKNYYTYGDFIKSSKEKLNSVVRKYFSPASFDFLCFYGYNFMARADMYKYRKQMANFLIEQVRYCVKNNLSDDKIKKLYNYIEIPQIIRDKGKFREDDFYYAIGDGNYLYGQVHSINRNKKEFEIYYVLFDEYNWDDNATYFFNLDFLVSDTYDLVIETSAFKKLEQSDVAAPFLSLFIERHKVRF